MSSKEFLRSMASLFAAVAVLTAATMAVHAYFAADDLAPVSEDGAVDGAAEPPKPMLELRSADDTHQSYISGYGDGLFRPDGNITRAEAASMFYGLLREKPAERLSFADVSEADWYYDALGLLAAYGIIDVDGNSAAPDETISRAEFVAMAARFFPIVEAECVFNDVDETTRWRDEIVSACARGFISGYGDGSFRPDGLITRAEATAVINRILGRSADMDYISGIILPLFDDVSPAHWAYGEIMEAALTHTPKPDTAAGETWANVNTAPLRRSPGLLFDGFDFYYIEDNGFPAVNKDVGGLHFGADGHYTSGDAEIDKFAKDTLAKICTDGMTQEQRLRAAFNYTRDSFSYLRRNYYKTGDTGWELEEARIMFQTGRGNCYCFAGVFYYLSRQLGYDSRIISGGVGWSYRPHGWVEIDQGGTTYIYDTELEMAYRKKGVYSYDFYHMAYADVPWPYKK